jgi:DNA-directed RNA polymerase subunit omega
VARITIEDCLEKVNNRFALIQLAFQRVKQLRNGAPRLIQTKNKEVVGALREIAAGLVTLEQAQAALPEGQDRKKLNNEG